MLSELKRRNVLRAASAYVVIAWLLLQVASILLPTFLAPPWVMQGVTILLVVGFPVVVGLSWAFDLTPEGVVRDRGENPDTEALRISGRTIDAGIIGVLVIAVALFAYDKFLLEDTPSSSARIRPAVAVLPFEIDDAERDTRLFADGLATELIARLSSWPSFEVIARAASFREELRRDIFQAAERLDARYFVTGELRRDKDQIRLNVSLTDATSGRVVWSDAFDGSLVDILALEEKISRAIVGQISPALLARESERAMREDPDNLDAWQAAHRGWWFVNTETQEGYAEANRWFDVAIEADPNWGWPYAAKGLVIYRSFLNGWVSRSEKAKSDLMKYAQTAVRLDPMDSFAHHALGHAYGALDRNDESIRALARGVQLNPSDAMAQACYGMQLAAASRSGEAIEAINKAMSLSPEDPWMYWYTLVLARAHFASGDYASSEEWALRSYQIKPNFPAFLHAVSAAAQQGKLDEAKRRVASERANRQLPLVEDLENSFLQHTEADYTSRLMEGLRLADFDNAGAETM